MMPAVPTIFTAMMNHPKLKYFDMSILEILHFGRRAAAAGGQTQIRGPDRLVRRGRLRPLGGLAGRHLQSDGRRPRRRLDRTAAAANHHLVAQISTTPPRGAEGRAWRIVRQGPAGHEGLLEKAERDGRAVRRRLSAHRRRRGHGRAAASSSSSIASRI